jgi:DNA-binding MarR family transcriptional regulator
MIVYTYSVARMNSVKRKKSAIMRTKDYEALAAFRYALRKFFRFSEETAAGTGLTTRQYQALLTIRGFPGKEEITVGDVAEWLQIRHHSAVGLVNRLVEQGLVVRRKGKRDKREVYIRITLKGKRILQKLAYINKQELRQLHLQSYLTDLIS